jgi:ABC-type nitrate/sulfonate/bicarbonate transport system substrate-binding protein
MLAWTRGLAGVVLAGLTLACTTTPARPSAGNTAAGPAAAPAAPTASAAPSAARPPASASSPAAAPAVQPLQKVRVDHIGIAAEAPLYLAIERGYLQELGIDVELVPLAGSAETVALLSSGQLDVGATAIGPGIYNVVARDVGVRLVADRGSNLPGRSTPSLAVRSELLERKPWSGYADLRGFKVAIAVPNSITEYYLERMLQRGGLQRGDVDVISPMNQPDMGVAFANRGIDAAIYNEPWATQQEQQGIIQKVVYADDVDPGGHVAGVLYSETFANNPAVARSYLVGWLRGVREYWDAYDGRVEFQRIVDALQKYTALKDEALIRKIPPTGQNPAGYLDPATLARYQDWFAERGQVPQKIDMAKLYDRSFAEYANGVLGPYEPVANPRRPS